MPLNKWNDNPEDLIVAESVRAYLAASIAKLPAKEQAIIYLRYAFDFGALKLRPLRIVAAVMGYSIEWTRRLELFALAKLKRQLRAGGIVFTCPPAMSGYLQDLQGPRAPKDKRRCQ